MSDERGEATTVGLVVALLVTFGATAVTSLIAFVFAQVDAGTGATNPATVVSGFASLGSVGGLVYIARKMVNGELVARAPHDSEQQLLGVVESLTELVEASHRREDQARDREREYRQFLVGGR